MKLLTQLTEQNFGYDPLTLSKGSPRQIYHECVICGEPKQNSYRNFVRGKAIAHQRCKAELKKQTNLQKYGVEHYSQTQSYKGKVRQTWNDKNEEPVKFSKQQENVLLVDLTRKQFGYTPHQLSKGTGAPIVIKCIVCENPKEVGFLKFLNNIGLSHEWCKSEVRKKTCIKVYGVDNPRKSEQVKKRIRQTWTKKYGVNNPQKCEQIRQKAKQTKIQKYDGGFSLHSKYSRQYWLQQDFEGCKINPNQDLPDIWSQGCNSKFEVICSCGKIFSPYFYNLTLGNTRSCGHGVSTSQAEQDIYNYIKDDLNIDCLHRHKIGNTEFDIYIPSKRIGIEHNGLVWHSELFAIDSKKDYQKYQFCQQNDIRYVGIYEDEWLCHQDRIRHYLKAIFGVKSKYTVRPQKLKVVYEPKGNPRKEIRAFLDQYHYAGGRTTFQHVWKCYHSDTLIAVLGIGSPTRQNIKEDYELKRVCLHPNYRCYGLWSFLLKRYVKPLLAPCILTSFSDNRRDTGKLYEKLGFAKIHNLRPDYYWIKGQQRFHKSGFKKTIEERKQQLTEKQLREAQGYSRLWDCGKMKWNLQLPLK